MSWESPSFSRRHSASHNRKIDRLLIKVSPLPPQPIVSSTSVGEFTETPVLQSTKRSPQPSNPSLEGHQRSNPVGDGQGELLQRVSNPPTHIQIQDLFRCFHRGMGCPYGPMQNLWVMVRAGRVPPHQHPGNQVGFHKFNLSTDFVIFFSSDNFTVVAYVNKHGGTRSVTLMEETYLLFHLSGGKESDSRLPVQTEPNPPIRMVSPLIHRPENPDSGQTHSVPSGKTVGPGKGFPCRMLNLHVWNLSSPL